MDGAIRACYESWWIRDNPNRACVIPPQGTKGCHLDGGIVYEPYVRVTGPQSPLKTVDRVELPLQFFRMPEVIGIKKRYPFTTCFRNFSVPGRARAFPLLNEVKGLRRMQGFRIDKCAS